MPSPAKRPRGAGKSAEDANAPAADCPKPPVPAGLATEMPVSEAKFRKALPHELRSWWPKALAEVEGRPTYAGIVDIAGGRESPRRFVQVEFRPADGARIALKTKAMSGHPHTRAP